MNATHASAALRLLADDPRDAFTIGELATVLAVERGEARALAVSLAHSRVGTRGIIVGRAALERYLHGEMETR